MPSCWINPDQYMSSFDTKTSVQLCYSLVCQSEWVCGRCGWTWFSLRSRGRERKSREAHTVSSKHAHCRAMQTPSNATENWGRGSDLDMTSLSLLIVTNTQKHTQVWDPSKSGTWHRRHLKAALTWQHAVQLQSYLKIRLLLCSETLLSYFPDLFNLFILIFWEDMNNKVWGENAEAVIFNHPETIIFLVIR